MKMPTNDSNKRARVMLLVATALTSGVTLSSCASSHGVTFVPPDANDDAASDASNPPDVLGFGVIDAGIVADVEVTDASDASDASSE